MGDRAGRYEAAPEIRPAVLADDAEPVAPGRDRDQGVRTERGGQAGDLVDAHRPHRAGRQDPCTVERAAVEDRLSEPHEVEGAGVDPAFAGIGRLDEVALEGEPGRGLV